MAESGGKVARGGDDGDGEDLERIEDLLRSLSEEDLEPFDPPDHVWAGIEAALAADPVETASTAETALTAETAAKPDSEPFPPGDDASDGSDGSSTAPISLDSRRARRPPWWLAAAAAAVLVAGGAAVFVRQTDDAPVVASAQLTFDAEQFDPLGSDASARVSLVDADGRLRIAFDEARLPADLTEDADLELWLIEPDSEGQVRDLRSLGLVDVDDLGSFPIPDDVDPDRFRVVDISVEPRDGDPAHSGRSILRGALEAS